VWCETLSFSCSPFHTQPLKKPPPRLNPVPPLESPSPQRCFKTPPDSCNMKLSAFTLLLPRHPYPSPTLPFPPKNVKIQAPAPTKLKFPSPPPPISVIRNHSPPPVMSFPGRKTSNHFPLLPLNPNPPQSLFLHRRQPASSVFLPRTELPFLPR